MWPETIRSDPTPEVPARWSPYFYVHRADGTFDVVYDGTDVGYYPAHVCTTETKEWAERIATLLCDSTLMPAREELKF